MKKEIRVYEGWKDISLGKMKGLEKIGEENKGLNEFELSCLYISYLYECEAKDLNFKEFQAFSGARSANGPVKLLFQRPRVVILLFYELSVYIYIDRPCCPE